MNHAQKIIVKEVVLSVMRSLLLALRKVILAFIALAFIAFLMDLFVIPYLPGGYFGRAAAERDVARGQYAIRHHGMQTFWRRDYKERLEDQYGIKALGVPGSCIVSHFGRTFDAEYNRVQRAAIIEHFGRDVVKEVDDEARAAWEEKRKQSSN